MGARIFTGTLGAAVVLATQTMAQTAPPAFIQHPQVASDAQISCLVGAMPCPQGGAATGTSIEDVVNWAPVDQQGAVLAPPSRQSIERIGDSALPSVDLEIFFEYNSDRLTPFARQQLDALIPALINAVRQNNRLVFVGHTDSSGGYEYNLALSVRRAKAVGDYVVARSGIAPDWVGTQGRSYSEPKNAFNTAAPENRRVQLVLYPR